MAADQGPGGTLVTDAFRHEAFLYRGQDEFTDVAAAFVLDAIDAGEPVLLAIDTAKGERVRDALGPDIAGHADDVAFVDITEIGRNPARIIPAWRLFLQTHHLDGRGARGIGEPVWAGRSRAELREAQRHEALLNVAFHGVRNFWLMCPTTSPPCGRTSSTRPTAATRTPSRAACTWRAPSTSQGRRSPLTWTTRCPTLRISPVRLPFGSGALSEVRRIVGVWAPGAGMRPPRSELLVLAVNELATNSIEHGGGRGELLMWRENGSLLAEVRDCGHIAEPLVGRFLPDQQQGGGRGVWLVNQVCDLVQIRTTPGRTTVRVQMSLL